MNTLGFYRAFEERFYAPRSTIKNMRRQYLPFVQPLAALYPGAATFDIGCGRGEWLELMQELGMSPFGIDLDAGMLQGCHELNLPAKQGDAVAYLRTLADNSQAVVTAFHVVEHISFEQLTQVVIESLRVLQPGGLLIMETPNPENIVVATRNFYLDPTHLRPIPSLLLSFLPEYHGFARVHTLRLQESPELRQRSDITLMEVFGGVSPDYAVVAQKAAAPNVMERFDTVFGAHYGIDLHDLAGRYDDTLQRRLAALEQRLTNAEANTHHWRQQASALEAERNALRQSTSWRITAPLRWAGSWVLHSAATVRTSANWVIHRSIHSFRRPLSRLIAAVLRRPQLSYRINRVLVRYPALYRQLLEVAQRGGVVAGMSAASAHTQRIQGHITAPELAHLTPRARQIHADLQQAIKNAKEID